MRIDAKPHNMNVFAGVDRRDFNAGDKSKALKLRGTLRKINTGHRVVIGQSHRANAALARKPYQRVRRQTAVAGC